MGGDKIMNGTKSPSPPPAPPAPPSSMVGVRRKQFTGDNVESIKLEYFWNSVKVDDEISEWKSKPVYAQQHVDNLSDQIMCLTEQLNRAKAQIAHLDKRNDVLLVIHNDVVGMQIDVAKLKERIEEEIASWYSE